MANKIKVSEIQITGTHVSMHEDEIQEIEWIAVLSTKNIDFLVLYSHEEKEIHIYEEGEMENIEKEVRNHLKEKYLCQ